MLGRAKWDSWNRQKGTAKEEAKNQYVVALVKVRSSLLILPCSTELTENRYCENTLEENLPRGTLQSLRRSTHQARL